MNPKGQAISVNFGIKPQHRIRDDRLVQAAQAGSATAFAEIRALYEQRLFRRIVLITKNREDAEDALQDTFLRAYLALGTFERRASVYSWLTRIAINSALMVVRRQRARAEVFFDLSYGERDDIPPLEWKDKTLDPEQSYSDHQRRLNLLTAIKKLEPKLRKPLEIHMTRECSMKEIAGVLNISVSAVKARLHRARRRLAASKGFRPPGTRGHLHRIVA